MRILVLAMLPWIVTGCATGAADSVICARTNESATKHAAALAKDGGPLSVSTGRTLIATLDAGCDR